MFSREKCNTSHLIALIHKKGYIEDMDANEYLDFGFQNLIRKQTLG